MTRPKTGAFAETTASLPKKSRMDRGQKAGSSPSLELAHRERVEDLLDEALQATFPASDPISIGGDRIQGASRRVSPSRRR